MKKSYALSVFILLSVFLYCSKSDSTPGQKNINGALFTAECQKIADNWKKNQADAKVWYDQAYAESEGGRLLGTWNGEYDRNVFYSFSKEVLFYLNVDGLKIPFYKYSRGRIDGGEDILGYVPVKKNFESSDNYIITVWEGEVGHEPFLIRGRNLFIHSYGSALKRN